MRSQNKETVNMGNFYYQLYLSHGPDNQAYPGLRFPAAFLANLQVFEFLSSCRVVADSFSQPIKYLSSIYYMQGSVLDVVLSYKRKSGRSCPKEGYRTIEGLRHLPRWRLRWSTIGIQRSFLSFAKGDLERSVEEVALEHLSIGRIWRCVIEGAKKSFPAKE